MEEALQMSGEPRLVINYGDATIGDPLHSVHGRCGSIVNIQYMAIHSNFQ